MANDYPTIRELLDEAGRLLGAGLQPERARRDARTLLLHLLRENAPERNLAWLIAHHEDLVTQEVADGYRALVERRRDDEPIQYIAEEVEFYGLAFQVNRDVLIPRPETEHVVERAIALAGGFERPRIVDVGTGSGAIAVALAKALPEAQIFATDISEAALAVAQANAERHGVADRVQFFEGDLLEPVAGERFEIVISNPPYVAEIDRDRLAVEVRDYEPVLALFAGADGLDVYRRLVPGALGALVPGGFVALEIGCGQKAAVESLLVRAGFGDIEFTEDLQRIPRVAVARRP
ncbi:MAG: peptide chain release factor N(5)-glutamine methyltransferase [Terracidiphilus sp.]|jgi:release factor glutamine methyltransferase